MVDGAISLPVFVVAPFLWVTRRVGARAGREGQAAHHVSLDLPAVPGFSCSRDRAALLPRPSGGLPRGHGGQGSEAGGRGVATGVRCRPGRILIRPNRIRHGNGGPEPSLRLPSWRGSGRRGPASAGCEPAACLVREPAAELPGGLAGIRRNRAPLHARDGRMLLNTNQCRRVTAQTTGRDWRFALAPARAPVGRGRFAAASRSPRASAAMHRRSAARPRTADGADDEACASRCEVRRAVSGPARRTWPAPLSATDTFGRVPGAVAGGAGQRLGTAAGAGIRSPVRVPVRTAHRNGPGVLPDRGVALGPVVVPFLYMWHPPCPTRAQCATRSPGRCGNHGLPAGAHTRHVGHVPTLLSIRRLPRMCPVATVPATTVGSPSALAPVSATRAETSCRARSPACCCLRPWPRRTVPFRGGWLFAPAQ